MAGYIFTLDNINSLTRIAETGVYSTKFKIPNKTWAAHHEGTFADYFSMKPGDNVYFFYKRKIYGIGVLVDIHDSCIFLNFPNADYPNTKSFNSIKNDMIINSSTEDTNKRFLCTFKGAPHIFKKGVDMDEVLTSNPTAFKMLRALWKLSFIKIDDIENQALFDCILKSNEFHINGDENCYSFKSTVHKKISNIYNKNYLPKSDRIIEQVAINDRIKHEMAIEAAMIEYLTKQTSNNIFGKWDYISHQVIASPFKPIDYMDKMDIFGYKYIPNYSTISEYLMIEIKKEIAEKEVINQAMKYVDWIEKEYSHDYSMINAYIVARVIPQDVIDKRNKEARRFYTKGRSPAQTKQWNNLRLIEYNYNTNAKMVEFNEIDPL